MKRADFEQNLLKYGARIGASIASAVVIGCANKQPEIPTAVPTKPEPNIITIDFADGSSTLNFPDRDRVENGMLYHRIDP